MGQKPKMIEAKSPSARIRRAYELYSHFYGRLVAPREHKPRMLGLERANVGPQDRVLEVAVGPGATLLEILKRVDRATVVCGIDLSPRMLKKARHLVNAAGYTNVALQEADARQLPFADTTFDVVYNSYMFDLLHLQDMPVVLSEFRRVLRPGGRLVLVNMSKKDASRRTWSERLYEWLPAPWVPYLMGGCRPVLVEGLVKESGFCDISREFLGRGLPSEIVAARTVSGRTG